jgi:hypothetical protein
MFTNISKKRVFILKVDMNMEAEFLFETSIDTYHIMWRQVPEDINIHLRVCAVAMISFHELQSRLTAVAVSTV